MADYKWTFQRIGGMDQAMLATSEEIRNLSELDPKLWCALSCPSSGMEFDTVTMKLIDEDGDGRIRIPEVVKAVN